MALHDLVYDYVQRAVADAKALQEKLLAAYRAKCPAGWHTGPNDGYFFEHHCRREVRSRSENPTSRIGQQSENPEETVTDAGFFLNSEKGVG